MQIMNIKDIVDPPESPINGLRCSDVGRNSDSLMSALSGPFDLMRQYSLDDSESFYDKLYGLYETSGLNLVLNARETLLNLHVFYKEVTLRGGYYQVTKDNRWEEVSMAMKLEAIKVKIPQQLQKVYAFFLYQFEQIYFFRSPTQVGSKQGQSFLTGTKRKSNSDRTTPQILAESETKKCNKDGSNSSFTGSSKRQQSKVKPQKNGRPRRMRTAYQIFIKKECERLRKSLGEKLIGQSFRFMADSAWRHLSETDRQPYVDESNHDKEIYFQEMKTVKENWGRGPGPRPDEEYHFSSEIGNRVPLSDQAAVHLAVEIMNNSPAESVFQNVQKID